MKIKEFYKNNLQFIEINNDNGFKVTFCALGASIFSIQNEDDYLTRNVKDIKDFLLPNVYYGKTIGRTANRIKGHHITIDGSTYKLANNEGDNVLHGGVNALSNQIFESQTNIYTDYIEVKYHYLSKHLESGYPGSFDITVTYRVFTLEKTIYVGYDVFSNQKTLCSLTNHTYFTLGSKDIEELKLQMNSSRYLEVDDELIATEIVDVNTGRDFRELKPLRHGYMIDNFFYMDGSNVVHLENDKYALDVESNFEGCQIYSSNGRSPVTLFPECANIFDSLAIEPSDSHLEKHYIEANEKYHREITYRFLEK